MVTLARIFTIDGIDVEVIWKKVCRINIVVYHKDARVVMTVPEETGEKAIMAQLAARIDRIKEERMRHLYGCSKRYLEVPDLGFVKIVRSRDTMDLRVRYPDKNSITDEGQVEVLAPPWSTEQDLRDFVLDNMDFVEQELAAIQAWAETLPQYRTGDVFRVWGEDLVLDVQRDLSESVQREGNVLHVHVFLASLRIRRRNLLRRYLGQCIVDIIGPMARHYGEAMDLDYIGRISCPYLSSQWASYNKRTKAITLSADLAQFPKMGVEYMFVRQLCLMVSDETGKPLQGLLDKYFPNWREADAMLDQAQSNLV